LLGIFLNFSQYDILKKNHPLLNTHYVLTESEDTSSFCNLQSYFFFLDSVSQFFLMDTEKTQYVHMGKLN